ncbi:OB-fold domain-containing protein [Mycolicibacterium farcinogenes]|uniref:Zn-ribbon domain-containing OB-fold protein n=1 Tax=Mycolicibacterium farcinogenes TaxID=1802 RepID=UPI001C8E6023|nr:OB-fold domain-containing protein [Mycolicibacterium farcinogenes]QZH58308.1 OB-fold domain-containing protein [Mycolicibacterium farcinogenes]
MTSRPLPIPDETSAGYWAAAADHLLAVAKCGRCGVLAMPPDVVCASCGSTDPEFTFTPVSGRAAVRSWVVVRQAFLPGFDAELPFVLVDVELAEQADLRMIGRLLDGFDCAQSELRIGAEVTVAFEDLSDTIAIPAFELVR